MENISKEQAVEIIKGAFELLPFEKKEEGKSFYGESEGTASFFFDKRQYTRDEVIHKLVECFNGKNIVGGQCAIDSMTILYTRVRIENRG